MATADARDALERAAQRAILLDRANKVMAARGLKTTLSADDRAERPLIAAHQSDEHARQQLRQGVEHDRDDPTLGEDAANDLRFLHAGQFVVKSAVEVREPMIVESHQM